MIKLKTLIALGLACIVIHANAGSRGLRIVMLDLDDSDFFASPAYVAFRDGEAPRLHSAQDCWNHRATAGASLSHTTRIKLPSGITKELGTAIWGGDKKSIIAAQKILRLGDDASGPQGYDGMFIVRTSDSTISVIGVGVNGAPGANNPSRKIQIQWRREAPMETAANFDLALCKAAKPMDYQFTP